MVGLTGESSIFPALPVDSLGIGDLVNHFFISHYKTSGMAANRSKGS